MTTNDKIEALVSVCRELLVSMEPKAMDSTRRHKIKEQLDEIQWSIDLERCYEE